MLMAQQDAVKKMWRHPMPFLRYGIHIVATAHRFGENHGFEAFGRIKHRVTFHAPTPDFLLQNKTLVILASIEKVHSNSMSCKLMGHDGRTVLPVVLVWVYFQTEYAIFYGELHR